MRREGGICSWREGGSSREYRVPSSELRGKILKRRGQGEKAQRVAQKRFLTAKDAKKGYKGREGKPRDSQWLTRGGLSEVYHFAHRSVRATQNSGSFASLQDDKAISCDARVSQDFSVASTQFWSMSAGCDGMGRELVTEELGGGFGGDGGREEVALAEAASEFFEGLALRRPFDSLGEDVDLPLVAQREEQFDDVAAGAVGEHIPDEKAIDLQKIDGDVARL